MGQVIRDFSVLRSGVSVAVKAYQNVVNAVIVPSAHTGLRFGAVGSGGLSPHPQHQTSSGR